MTDKGQNGFRIWCVAVSVLLGCIVTEPVRGDTWRLVKTASGIEIRERKVDDNPIRWLWAETRVRAPAGTLLALLLDIRNLPKWVAGYREVKILDRTGAESFRVYARIDMPLLMTDRDVVVRSTVNWRQGVLSIGNRLDRTSYRPTPDTIPFSALQGCWTVRPLPDGTTLIRYRGITDPSVTPAWLVNGASRDLLLRTFRRLKRQMQDPRYRQEGAQLEAQYHQRLQQLPIPEDCEAVPE